MEEEEQARQKLILDRKNIDNRLKELQDKYAQVQDSYDRLQAEKRGIEDKFAQLSNQLQEEEERSKQGIKYRQKVCIFYKNEFKKLLVGIPTLGSDRALRVRTPNARVCRKGKKDGTEQHPTARLNAG